MSDEVKDPLTAANGQAARYKHAKREAEARASSLQGELDALRKEYDAHKAGSVPKADLDAIKAELRSDRHKAAFDRVAKGLNVAVPTDDLIRLLGYQPETDLADETAIKTLLEDAIRTKPYLASPQKWEAGPGLAKGAADTSGRTFTVTRDQMADPLWKLANDKHIEQARRDGRLNFVD